MGSVLGNIAVKILIGVATAAVWFALSRAASAAQVGDHDRSPGVNTHMVDLHAPAIGR
jgi:hypothetical protein